MDFAFLISQSDNDSSDIVQLEAWVVLMEVRSDPAHPDTAGVLTREDPHWVVILYREISLHHTRLPPDYQIVNQYFLSSATLIVYVSVREDVYGLTVEACTRNSYSSLPPVITSSDTWADEWQLFSGLFLFNMNLADQNVHYIYRNCD